MSLIQKHRVLIAAAAALAVLGPAALLESKPQEAPVHAPLVVTPLTLPPPAMLDMARSAPVFSPERSVAAPPAPLGAADVAATPPPPPPPAPPPLVGVIARTGGKGIALLRSRSGETLTVRPGESVDEWRLVAVARDSVTLVRAGARHRAVLDFANKADAGAAAPPASPAPPAPAPPGAVPQQDSQR